MSIFDLEKWAPVPGRLGLRISSKGRVQQGGRIVATPEGSIKLRGESVFVADLVRQLFSNGQSPTHYRQMLLLKKPSAAFTRMGSGLQALGNRRQAVPLKPLPGP